MKVLVKFAGRPYNIINKPYMWFPLENDETTLNDVLTKIEAETGVKFNLKDAGVIILINGMRMEHIGGLRAKIKDMDEIIIASVAGGG